MRSFGGSASLLADIGSVRGSKRNSDSALGGLGGVIVAGDARGVGGSYAAPSGPALRDMAETRTNQGFQDWLRRSGSLANPSGAQSPVGAQTSSGGRRLPSEGDCGWPISGPGPG